MALDFFDRVDETYGAEDGTLEQSVYTSLSNYQNMIFQNYKCPMAESSDFGIDLYLSTIEFLNSV